MANYNFKKVIIHNFLSYGHSEIELSDKKYCLVKGINKCPLDNAVSNGSGKSSWISAICWCLTGETVSGNSSNIKNIFVDEDSCFVTLYFDVNEDVYEVTRIKEPNPNLKIIKNGVDISGKGIRESAVVLAQHLPDLTKDLITSVILLGQGLPNRFTNNTPSGRKEVLEKLSKSDFMIEDIKKRIDNRSNELNTKLRAKEDSKLYKEGQLKLFKETLSQLEQVRDTSVSLNYDAKIKRVEEEIQSISEALVVKGDKLADERVKLKTYSDELMSQINSKQKELEEELKSYNDKRDSLLEEKLKFNSSITTLVTEINRLKSIKDVCPTCGQKIPGVIKPDTTPQESQLKELEDKLTQTMNSINDCNNKHLQYVSEINNKFNLGINKINEDINKCKNDINTYGLALDDYSSIKTTKEGELIKLKLEKENHDKEWNNLLTNIKSHQDMINNATVFIETTDKEIEELNQHIAVINQMNTLVKRDFRGFLLSNIIDFINVQAKEYCNDIFGTRELEFKLDGNNIDIEYCGKDFSSLSGGEKQRVDLIIQFSIRKMMSQYLDFNSNILCLDEIFDNLDAKATTNVINLISDRLSDIESVFIISHHADELSIPYDNDLIVEKNENGISSAYMK